MIRFNEAYNIVIGSVEKYGTEQVDISDSLNRVLADDVKSDLDMPPFDKSAMDGYACREEDLVYELEVIETIPAGCTPRKSIGKCECSKIMTGAMMPKGANCVVIVEETEVTGTSRVKVTGSREKSSDGNFSFFQKRKGNICYQGEDVKQGEIVLHKGEIIKPQHIAVLATVGCVKPCVSVEPKVGIIATGSELVEPHQKANGAMIRNSNSYQLSAQVKKMSAIPNYYGIAEDTEEAIDRCVKQAIVENDVILISGGVSMGDYDFVPEVMKKNGIEILFNRVAIQPGKPMTFGISDDIVCFGVPGNPVSTFVQFEILIKPFLYKMMGHDFNPKISPLILGETIKRSKSDRESLIPIEIRDNKVYQIAYHGSAHINAMSTTEYLVSIPIGTAEIKEGTVVNVRQI